MGSWQQVGKAASEYGAKTLGTGSTCICAHTLRAHALRMTYTGIDSSESSVCCATAGGVAKERKGRSRYTVCSACCEWHQVFWEGGGSSNSSGGGKEGGSQGSR
jgi:hypothetical protein